MGIFTKGIKKINMDQAKKEMDADSDILLIDVRTKDEYKQKHIKGSINIPLNEIERHIPAIINKNTKIFLYCLSGARSSTAAKLLYSMGYKDVASIGGITKWKYETVEG